MDAQLGNFTRWSVLHGGSAAACAASLAGLVLLGRRWRRRSPGKERALRIAWVISALAFQAYTQIWWALPENFLHDASLPLHLCDLVIWFAPFALIWNRRLACTLLYFWGVGLSMAAFVYPTITEGPAQTEFWLYWVGHTQIVGSGLYLVSVCGYRPSGRDLANATLALLVYYLALIPIDFALDVDYGYLGPASAIASVLGPWPARLLALFVLETAVFVLLWLALPTASNHAAAPTA